MLQTAICYLLPPPQLALLQHPVPQPQIIMLPIIPRPSASLFKTPPPFPPFVPGAVPSWVPREIRAEIHNGVVVPVEHFAGNPAAARGWNPIHGNDVGPLPPGLGSLCNPFPCVSRGWNPVYGYDEGLLPPEIGPVSSHVSPPNLELKREPVIISTARATAGAAGAGGGDAAGASAGDGDLGGGNAGAATGERDQDSAAGGDAGGEGTTASSAEEGTGATEPAEISRENSTGEGKISEGMNLHQVSKVEVQGFERSRC